MGANINNSCVSMTTEKGEDDPDVDSSLGGPTWRSIVGVFIDWLIVLFSGCDRQLQAVASFLRQAPNSSNIVCFDGGKNAPLSAILASSGAVDPNVWVIWVELWLEGWVGELWGELVAVTYEGNWGQWIIRWIDCNELCGEFKNDWMKERKKCCRHFWFGKFFEQVLNSMSSSRNRNYSENNFLKLFSKIISKKCRK